MIGKGEKARMAARGWWQWTADQAAFCEKCTVPIPRGEGYLCKPGLLAVKLPHALVDTSGIPDLLCQACFRSSPATEPWIDWQGRPLKCDTCGSFVANDDDIRHMVYACEAVHTETKGQTSSIERDLCMTVTVALCKRCWNESNVAQLKRWPKIRAVSAALLLVLLIMGGVFGSTLLFLLALLPFLIAGASIPIMKELRQQVANPELFSIGDFASEKLGFAITAKKKFASCREGKEWSTMTGPFSSASLQYVVQPLDEYVAMVQKRRLAAL